MQIIHGDDEINSYKYLSQLVVPLNTTDVKDLDATTLRQLLSANSLFGDNPPVVIRNLLSVQKSKNKDILTDIIKNNPYPQLTLYETKELTPTQLKTFPEAKINVFKLNPIIFKFTDALRPGNAVATLSLMQQLIAADNAPEYINYMIMRQIRLLLQAKSDPDNLRMAPYPKKLVLAQAKYFTLDKLLDLHHRLVKIDCDIKSGGSSIPLDISLFDFLRTL